MGCMEKELNRIVKDNRREFVIIFKTYIRVCVCVCLSGVRRRASEVIILKFQFCLIFNDVTNSF